MYAGWSILLLWDQKCFSLTLKDNFFFVTDDLLASVIFNVQFYFFLDQQCSNDNDKALFGGKNLPLRKCFSLLKTLTCFGNIQCSSHNVRMGMTRRSSLPCRALLQTASSIQLRSRMTTILLLRRLKNVQFYQLLVRRHGLFFSYGWVVLTLIWAGEAPFGINADPLILVGLLGLLMIWLVAHW